MNGKWLIMWIKCFHYTFSVLLFCFYKQQEWITCMSLLMVITVTIRGSLWTFSLIGDWRYDCYWCSVGRSPTQMVNSTEAEKPLWRKKKKRTTRCGLPELKRYVQLLFNDQIAVHKRLTFSRAMCVNLILKTSATIIWCFDLCWSDRHQII